MVVVECKAARTLTKNIAVPHKLELVGRLANRQ